MQYTIVYGAGTASELKKGIPLFHYPTRDAAEKDLAEYNRLCKKHGEPVTEESEDYFSVYRNGFANTYKIKAL